MTYRDTSLYLRTKVLEWVTYDHLDIKPALRVDSLWNIAAKCNFFINSLNFINY